MAIAPMHGTHRQAVFQKGTESTYVTFNHCFWSFAGMKLLRPIGYLFLAVAAVSFVTVVVTSVNGSGSGVMTSFGEQWGKLNPGGLNLVQAIVQRYLHPALWDPILVDILLLPGWLVFGAPGLLFFFLGGSREINDLET